MIKTVVTLIIALGASIVFAGCCAAPPPPAPPPPPVEPEPEPEPVPPPKPEVSLTPGIWTTVEEVQTDCAKHLANAAAIRDEIVAIEGENTLENTLKRLNDLHIEFNAVLPRAGLFAAVSPSKEVRDAAEKCEQDGMKLITEISLDRNMYDAITAVKTDELDVQAKRFMDHELRDYKRSGVDKDDATRKELGDIQAQMLLLGQNFQRTIREGKLSIKVTADDLKGVPADFIASHPADEKGKITITTDYPDFFPVVNYAENAKVRKDIYTKYQTRGHPENAATLKELLQLRYKYATMLGYSDWADYNAEDKMVKDKKVISDFIDEVADIARPRMKKDLKVILARKKKDKKNTKAVEVWDRFYYVNKIKKEEYGVDAQVVRSYFPYPKVRDGLLGITSKLFGLTFEKVEDAAVWDESVETYNVREGEELVGRFYLDMHPREGKYGHAALFTMRTGVKDIQLPTAVLVCNFPRPTDADPGLMGHSEVTTFFHEFGHLMHSIVAGRQEWKAKSGIACEWDFVETPSQLLESWAWDYEILKGFAAHHETNEVIPKELVEKMRQADEFGKGIHVMRQMFFAALSFSLHDKDPSNLDLLKAFKKLQRKYNPYPYQRGTHAYSSFGHIVGYSSMYYTYMWSLVLTKDILQEFEKNGMMDPATALSYRKNIIEPGGTIDSDIMVKNFLGREYSFEAFKNWLEKE